MFLKKNIIFVGFLIITTLLTTGCEWPSCMKKKCQACPTKSEKETVVMLEEENSPKEESSSNENESDENEK
jgi:hypothetical protein